MPELAASTRLLRDLPVLEAIPAFRRAGFTTLELCAAPRHFDPSDLALARSVRAECRRSGIRVLSLHAPYSAPLDITVIARGERSRAVREVTDAAQALAEIGGSILVIHTGSELRPDANLEMRMEALAESLQRVHTRCRALGIKLALEEMAPHMFGGRDEDLDRLARLDPRPFDGFCLDVAHSFESGSLARRVRLLLDRLVLMHLSDTAGAVQQGHLLPGDGRVPWRELLTAVGPRGKNVPFVLEADGWGAPPGETLKVARDRLEALPW
ncbi:MAG: sugar phosphate isomerase/epimerase family protein [Acidobacteriota bacterium]